MQGLSAALTQLADHASGDVQAPEITSQADDRAETKVVLTSEQGKGGFQSRAKVAFDIRGQFAAGRSVAARASQAMELILDDIGNDNGEFSNLMTHRIGIITRKRLTTTTTVGGLARDELSNLVGGKQRTLLARMARLSTRLLFGQVSRARRAAFAVKAVRRRGQGGIRGIGGQLGVSLSQLLLKLLDLLLLLLDSSLGLFEFPLEFTDGAFQFLDVSLRIRGF